jgi:Microtubule binding
MGARLRNCAGAKQHVASGVSCGAAAVQMRDKNAEKDSILREFDRIKQHNLRLEITNKDFQEKMLANEAMLMNYKLIQDENRRLYNQVQDLQGNIRVFCRCAPRCLDVAAVLQCGAI